MLLRTDLFLACFSLVQVKEEGLGESMSARSHVSGLFRGRSRGRGIYRDGGRRAASRELVYKKRKVNSSTFVFLKEALNERHPLERQLMIPSRISQDDFSHSCCFFNRFGFLANSIANKSL